MTVAVVNSGNYLSHRLVSAVQALGSDAEDESLRMGLTDHPDKEIKP